jgi:hypothetical protein
VGVDVLFAGVGDAVATLVVVGVPVTTDVGRGVVVAVDADDAARKATIAARLLTTWGNPKVAA